MSDKNISSADKDVSIKGVSQGPARMPKGIHKDTRKRWMFVGAVAVTAIAITSTWMSTDSSKVVEVKEAPRLAVETTPKGLSENKDWRAQTGADLVIIKRDLEKTSKILSDLLKGAQETRSDIAELRRNQGSMPQGAPVTGPASTIPDAPNSGRERPSNILLPDPPKVPASLAGARVNPDASTGSETPTALTPPLGDSASKVGGDGGAKGAMYSGVPTAPSPMVRDSEPVVAKRAPAVSFIPENTPVENAEESRRAEMLEFERNEHAGFLPAGSFAKATMISGVEAFTGGTAQSQPQPMVIRIDANAVLPNAAKYQIRGCHVLASVYGDMSSERVYGRLATLTCVDTKDNLVLSQEIEGTLVDSDGKNGIRGQLIDRQGAKLARSLLAGLAEGMSDALGAAQSTSMATGSGVTTAFTGSHVAAAGYGGAGRAAEQLSEFYLKQAEATMPVIAVDAGRRISVLITKSQSLSFKSADEYREVPKDNLTVVR